MTIDRIPAARRLLAQLAEETAAKMDHIGIIEVPDDAVRDLAVIAGREMRGVEAAEIERELAIELCSQLRSRMTGGSEAVERLCTLIEQTFPEPRPMLH
jgi:hypothetical protein